jgi:serine/threonine protein kinase
MGMVYRGWDEVLEREVAVKTLTVEGTLDEESRQRFQIEARAAARLQHANIVTVFELGEDRGLPFHRHGAPPGRGPGDARALGRVPAPGGEARDHGAGAARPAFRARARHRAPRHQALEHPLLEDGTAKIMDFGIAKLGGTGVTKTGMMVGTIHYMSPEQIRGKKLDGRSDVFSSGVILYELLCGSGRSSGTAPTPSSTRSSTTRPRPWTHGGGGGPGAAGRPRPRAGQGPGGPLSERGPHGGGDRGGGLAPARPASAPPPDVLEAVNVARRLVKEGKVDDALHRLQDVTQRHPRSIEVAARPAHRRPRARARLKPREPEAQDFPELDATYQGSPRRRSADTVCSRGRRCPRPSCSGHPAPASRRRVSAAAARPRGP